MTKNLALANDILLGEICTLLLEGKKIKLRPKGTSMRPFILEDKDQLVIYPPNTLRKGDIVLARIDGCRYVIHRIIKIKDNRFVLMGDGNLFGYEQCSRDEIFGIADCIFRNEQRISLRSIKARGLAFGWRMLLPIRQIFWKLKHLK